MKDGDAIAFAEAVAETTVVETSFKVQQRRFTAILSIIISYFFRMNSISD